MAQQNKLEKLYQTVANCEDLGLELPNGVLEQISDMEEQLIKDEVLPLIHDNIEPTLKRVKRPLVLVVEYDPNGALRVNLSRKANITAQISDAKEITPDPEVSHSTRISTGKRFKKNPKTIFSVTFPDGTVLDNKDATDILEETVRKIGVERVREVVEARKLKFCKIPVISNRRDAKYGKTQRDLGNGWLLITHSNNIMKKQFLETVSEALNLGLEVTVKKNLL